MDTINTCAYTYPPVEGHFNVEVSRGWWVSKAKNFKKMNEAIRVDVLEI